MQDDLLRVAAITRAIGLHWKFDNSPTYTFGLMDRAAGNLHCRGLILSRLEGYDHSLTPYCILEYLFILVIYTRLLNAAVKDVSSQISGPRLKLAVHVRGLLSLL